MGGVNRMAVRMALIGLVAGLWSRPAFAQIDLTGAWAQLFHEDALERGPGPEVGDYLGLPITDAARVGAEAWSASQFTLPEWQCRQHQTGEIIRAPQPLTMWKEINPVSRELIAWHAEWSRTNESSNVIWMDGRPHPPEYALHTFRGFSTGKWEGDVLTVTTTHLKEGWFRRNGVPRSDKATIVQHFIRRGEYLTVVSFTFDPVYATEPMVQSSEYRSNPDFVSPPWPCIPVVEVVRPQGQVPSNVPVTDDEIKEFAKAHNLPVEAARGGAATMYPEFMLKFKQKSDGAQGSPASK